MQDDRDRYLAEIELQADNGPDYIMAFIGAHIERFPWTIELINCGLAIGNIAYSYYKAMFKRVRPSFLCPEFAPPFGPPGHPSFTSGHSFLAHLMALLLLEIPGIRQRYGTFPPVPPNSPPTGLAGRVVQPYPIVTISQASAAVVTLNSPGLSAHGISPGEQVMFQTNGTLPSPITTATAYYVLQTGLTPASFEISTTAQGQPIATTTSGSGTHTINRNPLMGWSAINSPLLWLSQRIAKNRERLGVHYPSDSMAAGTSQPPFGVRSCTIMAQPIFTARRSSQCSIMQRPNGRRNGPISQGQRRLPAQYPKAEVVVIRHQVDKRRRLLTAWKVRRSVNVGEVVCATRPGEENVAFAGC